MNHLHPHGEEERSWGRRLVGTMVLNLIIPAVQLYGGIVSGSVALVSDALHNLSDFLSVLISYVALKVGRRGPSLTHTFGYRRVEVLAALFNVSILFAACLFIVIEAWERFSAPEVIDSHTVIGIASVAFAANVFSTAMLRSGAKRNMNIRGAFLHMLSDSLVSLGVVVVGVIWLFRPWYWLDPLVSWAIVGIIFYSGWDILKQALLILMDAAPPGLDLHAIQREVEAIEGIEGIHHLHVWSVASEGIALATHIVVADQMLSEVDALGTRVREVLVCRFNIDHPILQFETRAAEPMALLCCGLARQAGRRAGGEE